MLLLFFISFWLLLLLLLLDDLHDPILLDLLPHLIMINQLLILKVINEYLLNFVGGILFVYVIGQVSLKILENAFSRLLLDFLWYDLMIDE